MKRLIIVSVGLLLAGCTHTFETTAACTEADGCLNDWYQYQMMSVDPQTGKVTTGPTPVTSPATPQSSAVEGTQGGAPK
jgi:hypothetical protein